ncbi:uncharacterized protein LOC21404494 isoform X1 [Morus notabilis]|uniref:uncharacterized protein LOC21404494 isoform X1 n=1 Tax=Morus notabilis TaxID=981085 RepID=UPI000CED26E0|nr:uncharacterized protein LOC21404494 isoform X1 [Morus notabilis]
MEILYLLCSILSTFLSSLILSVLLPFRFLLRRCGLSPAAATDSLSLYEGTVWHERRRPVHHAFRYSVRYALIGLDGACSPLPSHLSADEARRFAGSTGPVLLLTIPESVGYEQNPLSLYYCYDVEDSSKNLNKCIAEVTNTPWGERGLFVFDPKSDLIAKPLHVSPFMDMLGNWSIKANAPGDNLFVAISVQHPTLGDYFTATLRAKKVSSSSVSDHSLFFWLMPHKVAVWIYWHEKSIGSNLTSKKQKLGPRNYQPKSSHIIQVAFLVNSTHACLLHPMHRARAKDNPRNPWVSPCTTFQLLFSAEERFWLLFSLI